VLRPVYVFLCQVAIATIDRFYGEDRRRLNALVLSVRARRPVIATG